MADFDITIAGEINLDLILYGLPECMPVEREVIANSFVATLGSSSAILAHNLAALGLNVGFATKVGSDSLGGVAFERLKAIGVNISCPAPKNGEQTGVTVLLHHGDRRHILSYLGVMAQMTAADIDFSFISSSRHFHISSLFLQKSLLPDLPGLCRHLKELGITLSLDTNDDPDDLWGEPLGQLLDLVDVVLPNEDEAKRMAHTDDLDRAIESLAQRVPVVAVKCGKRGSIVRKGRAQWTIPPLDIEPIDTIGAGDSFNCGFLKGYVSGLPVEECAFLGNIVAALSTQRPGGTEAFRNAALVRDFLDKHKSSFLDARGDLI